MLLTISLLLYFYRHNLMRNLLNVLFLFRLHYRKRYISCTGWFKIIYNLSFSSIDLKNSNVYFSINRHYINSRKANSLMASLVKPRVTWFSFENVDIFVGHENCRTKTSFIYTVENIETSYIVFFSAIITSTICLLDLS